MKKLLLLFLILPYSSFAQNNSSDCNCCSEAHKAFDFWLGEWIVYDTTGKELGTNKILSLQDHCILQENWVAPNNTGSSYNYYDSKTARWNQVWVDNKGGSLVLKGGLEDGIMKMRGEYEEQSDGQKYCNEISWQAKEDGSVIQTWTILDEAGKVVNTIFKGIYRKKAD